jgi:hypothetical protein
MNTEEGSDFLMLELNDVFSTLKLYQKVDFSFAKAEGNKLILDTGKFLDLCNLLYPTTKPHLFCPHCHSLEPYEVKSSIFVNGQISTKPVTAEYPKVTFDFQKRQVLTSINGEDTIYWKFQMENEKEHVFIGADGDSFIRNNVSSRLTVLHEGTCLNCERSFFEIEFSYSDYDFGWFSERELEIKKIFPSPTSFMNPINKDMGKILEKINAMSEYSASINSYYDGYYIGSALYLRRTFEKLLLYYLRRSDPQDISNAYLKRFPQRDSSTSLETMISSLPIRIKLDIVKEKFMNPNIFEEIDDFYQIISLAVHEKDEIEAKEYYNHLIVITNMQLMYESHQQEEEELKKTLIERHKKILDSM